MAERAEIVLAGKDTTAAAFASARRNLDSLQASAVGIAGRLGAVAAAATTAVLVLDRFNPKSVIDTADEFSKLTQRTGIAVEQLSAYGYAAKLADVSQEDLSASLKRLNLNIAAAARGEGEQANAFKAIGVAVVDASGKVRSADAVFADIAEAFSGYADGANKVALANAVGGKTFEQLIPLLNGGRQGLIDARIEAEKFGIVISDDLAKKSNQFNDNLTRLAQASDALKVSIAGGLIDQLVKVSDRLVDAAKSGNLFLGILKELDQANPAAKAGQDFADKIAGLFKDSPAERLAKLNEKVAELQQRLAQNPGDKGLTAYLAKFQKKLAEVQASTSTVPDVAGAAFRANLKAGGAAFTVPPKEAPRLKTKDTSAADQAEALLRKQLEGRIKLITSTAERERDVLQAGEAALAAQYAAGEISIQQFYDAKNRIALDSLAAQSEAAQKEIAVYAEFRGKLTKPTDRADLDNKVAEVAERQAKAFREQGQAATAAEQERVRATDDFRRSLVELDAQLADLSGNAYGAELLRNAQRLDEARTLLAKGGGDPAREGALRQRLQDQAAFNALQERNARINEQAQMAEEAFLIDATRRGIGRNQAEKELGDIRTRSIADLDRLIADTAELARTTQNPDVIAFFDRVRIARERAFDAKDPGLLRFNELAAQAGQTTAQAFEDAAFSGGKLSDVVDNLIVTLGKLVFKDLITEPLSKSITEAIKSINPSNGATGSPGAGGDSGGGWLGLVAKFFSGFFADGGYIPPGKWGMTGERGPEPVFGGRTGVTVQSAEAGQSGQVYRFDFSGQTINIGQGVSRGEVAAAVQQGNAATEARVRRLMAHGAI